MIGVDTGVHTGYAVWHVPSRRLTTVATLSIHEALLDVLQQWKAAQNAGCPRSVFVAIEDARMRTWFNSADARQRKYGAAIREGVGSVKRDAGIWEDFLIGEGIPHEMRSPRAGCTKWKPEYFAKVTGWQGRTSEHARDAGVLVFGTNLPMAQGMVRAWEQRHANKATHTQASR